MRGNAARVHAHTHVRRRSSPEQPGGGGAYDTRSPGGADGAPFNPRNVLLDAPFLTRLLTAYDHPGSPGSPSPIRDLGLFRKALVHRSYCTRKNENFVEGNAQCPSGCVPLQEESNERLEFLGDAVLNLVVAAYLFERFPDENEGFLTRMRTKLVNGLMLADLMPATGLDRYILLSRQVEEGTGRANRKVLEDCFEAFIGAMFLDAGEGGFVACARWLAAFLETNLDISALVTQHNNHKDALAKHFQHAFNCMPRFVEVDGGGPSGGGIGSGGSGGYTVAVRDRDGCVVATGSGATKKAAENEAARRALLYYGVAASAAGPGGGAE